MPRAWIVKHIDTMRRGLRTMLRLPGITTGLAILMAATPAEKGGDGVPAGEGVPTQRIAAVLDVTGPIGPATSDYVARGIEKARRRGAAVVILRMDTPGGLDTSMREIIRSIIDSPIPVVTFVPSGARAASAGTYIAYASHIAAMAPGANLGAATPVRIGGGAPFSEPDERDRPDDGKEKQRDKKAGRKGKAGETTHPSMDAKAINDAVAYIRSLAQMRGRNVEWAEKAVREAASIAAEDAAKQNVIDVVARDVPDLLAKIDGRTVSLASGTVTLSTAELPVVTLAPDWRSEVLSVITNPNVAYLLLMIGIYGLIFEFYSPGMIGPGVFGAISLLLGLYALHLLPVSYAGIALTLLGLALMVAEAFTPSIGVLGIGGLAAFVAGSVLLIDTDVPGFGLSWYTVGAAAATSALFFFLMLAFLARSRRRAVVSGAEYMIGATGRVLDWSGTEGHVRVQGETWAARAPKAIAPGGTVRVRRIDGLTLEVEEAGSNMETGEQGR